MDPTVLVAALLQVIQSEKINLKSLDRLISYLTFCPNSPTRLPCLKGKDAQALNLVE